jgi:L-asparaginase
MKKILVIFTGGTIGSSVDQHTINVNEETRYKLLSLFHENNKLAVGFETLQPLNILSENLMPQHWEVLHSTLKKIDVSLYDGIIITHGSDTMPYTAAMIAFLFNQIKIPIVFVASNYPLGEVGSNGLNNFKNAVDFICHTSMKGIFTIYENNRGESVVYLPTRMMEADLFHDQYASYGDVNLGCIVNGELILNKNNLNPTSRELLAARESVAIEQITFENEILALKLFPGLNFEYIHINSMKLKAVMINLYHSSTGCITQGDYSLLSFIKRCKERGIDVYLLSFKSNKEKLYITSRTLLDNGAIPLKSMAYEGAVAKLNIAYNQSIMSPQDFMEKELYFEFLK